MVLLSVPLAWVGGVAAVLLTGGDVALGSMVGFVTVFGIAVRNGILLISHYQHLQQSNSTSRSDLTCSCGVPASVSPPS